MKIIIITELGAEITFTPPPKPTKPQIDDMLAAAEIIINREAELACDPTKGL